MRAGRRRRFPPFPGAREFRGLVGAAWPASAHAAAGSFLLRAPGLRFCGGQRLGAQLLDLKTPIIGDLGLEMGRTSRSAPESSGTFAFRHGRSDRRGARYAAASCPCTARASGAGPSQRKISDHAAHGDSIPARRNPDWAAAGGRGHRGLPGSSAPWAGVDCRARPRGAQRGVAWYRARACIECSRRRALIATLFAGAARLISSRTVASPFVEQGARTSVGARGRG